MKNAFIIIILLSPLISTGQEIITLSKYPQQVPAGKKWVLKTDQELLVEVSYGVLNTGSMCNARFLSTPGILAGVVEGEYGRPNEVYGLLFKDASKAAYYNNQTFSLVPVAIVNSDFNLSELRTKSPENIGFRSISFLPDQKVFVGECLNSIQLIELNLTKQELQAIEDEKRKIRLEEERKKKEIEEKKRNAQIAFEQSVTSSNDFFPSYKLSNEKSIDINIAEDVNEIIFDYLNDFKTQYSDGYSYMLKTYEDNLKYARANGNKPEDYALYDLRLYVDKIGHVVKLTVTDVLIKGEGMKEVEFPPEYLEEIRKSIAINIMPQIRVSEIDYPVNAHFNLFFTPFSSKKEYSLIYSINKKGEFKFYETSGLTETDIITFLKRDESNANQVKGKYSCTLQRTNYKLRLTHFQNFDQQEFVIKSLQIDEVTKLQEL